MHNKQASAKVLEIAEARLAAAQVELQAATKAVTEARAAHTAASAALATLEATVSAKPVAGAKRSSAAMGAAGATTGVVVTLATRSLKPPGGKLATKACRPSAPLVSAATARK